MNLLSPTPQHRAALRDLQAHLAQAGDGKLREIVALVDSMPERGAADTLIAPLRGRLTMLRPQRRMSLNRFLFLPADPVITPASQWRRTALAFPRSAIACLGQVIRAGLGDDTAEFSGLVDGVMSDDHAQLLRHGRLIWPRAAAILGQLHMPPEWPGMTGLTAQDFLAITRPLAVLLFEAAAVEQMVLSGPNLDELTPPFRACLTHALAEIERLPSPENATMGSRCLGLLLTVLLARMPNVEALLVASGDFATRTGDPIARLAADSAVDTLLDQAEARLLQPGAGIGAGELSRFAALIEAVEQPGPACRPSRKPRAVILRRGLDAYCRERFEADLSQHLLPHLPHLDAQTSDELVGDLEEAALDLRRLETVGRLLGNAAHYERALAVAGKAVLDLAGPDARCSDLARLSEILLGPEAGLAVLEGAPPCEA